MKVKTKRLINFVLHLCTAAFVIISVVFSIVRDTNIDIQKQKQITGRITFAETRMIENLSLRWKTYAHVFFFKLDNSTEKFVIYRADESYTDLEQKIKTGDTVKVYYRPSIADYNRHVFQLQKGDAIPASYSDYNKEASKWTGIGLLLGIIYLIGSIMWFYKISIFHVLNYFVEGKQINNEASAEVSDTTGDAMKNQSR